MKVGFTLSNISIYYKAIINKTLSCQHRERQLDQMNEKSIPEVDQRAEWYVAEVTQQNSGDRHLFCEWY